MVPNEAGKSWSITNTTLGRQVEVFVFGRVVLNTGLPCLFYLRELYDYSTPEIPFFGAFSSSCTFNLTSHLTKSPIIV